MFKSQIAESDVINEAKLKAWYSNTRVEYLKLCKKYGLPPKDITLSDIGHGEFESGDREKFIKLLVKLRDIEKLLGPGEVKDQIFSEDEAQFKNSAIFFNLVH